MGIDFGTKRIGIAITDPLKIFASPLTTIKTGEFDAFISEYIKTEAIDEFVIGYPVQMNNKSSESVKHIDPFFKKFV